MSHFSAMPAPAIPAIQSQIKITDSSQIKTADGLIPAAASRYALVPDATIDMSLRQCCRGSTDGEDSGTGSRLNPSETQL